MNPKKSTYRKNYVLVLAFIIVLTVSWVVAMVLANDLVVKRVEADFTSRKVEILDHNLYAFNDFFANRIPEISYYQGYLDSATASVLSQNILNHFPFVEKVRFYDVILNPGIQTQYGISFNKLIIYPTNIVDFQFRQSETGAGKVLESQKLKHLPTTLEEFNTLALKFGIFLTEADTSRSFSEMEVFKSFYSVTPGKVSYLNIPRRDDMKVYKDIMNGRPGTFTQYANDMFVFYIDPNKIALENTVPELYESIEIQPLVYDLVNRSPGLWITEAPLPGALADYKLYLKSSDQYVQREIQKRLFPVLGGILLLYLFLIMFAYLIYRNLYINNKMFKLQYDFINNLTHEFKTPVSVIKIAGNNIGNAKQLSDHERALYSRILDEESDKLNNLMNTLLSFTQIENKVITLKYEDIVLLTFCENIVTGSKLKYPDMEFSLLMDEGVPETFRTDPVLLASVFRNMIDNAYKYSNAGQRSMQIGIRRRRKHLDIRFKDTGIGIEKKEMKHIFKKFYRVQTRYNQQGSVGLGLAFSSEIVNFMGGEITVTSEVGLGTSFHVYLPLE